MAVEMKLSISKFVSEKITDRKLNNGNFLQWKRVVEIYVTGKDKDHHLSGYPPNAKTQTWRQEMRYFYDRSWTTWSHMFRI